MVSLHDRMQKLVADYRDEQQDRLDVGEAVDDAEHFLCDGVGGNCVSLMQRILELEDQLTASKECEHRWGSPLTYYGDGRDTQTCYRCGLTRRVA